ncbi:phospholipase, partial [Burkholderia pseudomallei]|nr:phospholipase [Burkholderia pseudomallei]MBF3728114.1 phospholipase [Burkholderia pseudomallei]MBF3913042.1 phospholipase [Burkholderia pseudomallei]MBF3913139.1 phospholipase [Burkholderia pseudomallei]
GGPAERGPGAGTDARTGAGAHAARRTTT